MKTHPLTNLLTVDVGNTTTSFACFIHSRKQSRPKPEIVVIVPTSKLLGGHKLSVTGIKSIGILRQSREIWQAMVSSVVPDADRELHRFLRRSGAQSVHFVSAQMKGRVKIRYKIPTEVGADRIVNARAAMAFHSGSSIVVDFGTATTFDCVTSENEYLGGVIAPGPLISAEALYHRTAKLPKVVLDKPVSILGRNTLQCIQSGLYYGYRGLVKEIVAQLKRKMGEKTVVFATGGQAPWILKGLNVVDHYMPLLTHQGLRFLWLDGLKANLYK